MADQVQRYARWLVSEAIPAGALGPREAERLEDRHLADAVVLARPWRTMPQPSVVDLGSGAGLPGIVTAILRPDARVCLVERAGRRLDLLGRALRVLELSNVTVGDGDLHALDARYDVALMRAVLPTHEAVPVLRRVLEPTGLGVLAGSRRHPPPSEPPDGTEVVTVPVGILDSPGWFLKIHPRDA